MSRSVLVLLVLLLPVSVTAQPRCNKGKPCGNSCIAQSKTCRIGTPVPAPTKREPTTSTRPPTSNTPPVRVFDPAARQATADSLASVERARAAMTAAQRPATMPAESLPRLDLTLSPFVGDASRKVFFKRGCGAATRVKEDDLVVFQTEAAAVTAGYARSGAEGC